MKALSSPIPCALNSFWNCAVGCRKVEKTMIWRGTYALRDMQYLLAIMWGLRVRDYTCTKPTHERIKLGVLVEVLSARCCGTECCGTERIWPGYRALPDTAKIASWQPNCGSNPLRFYRERLDIHRNIFRVLIPWDQSHVVSCTYKLPSFCDFLEDIPQTLRLLWKILLGSGVSARKL